jgi:hypothetical protein
MEAEGSQTYARPSLACPVHLGFRPPDERFFMYVRQEAIIGRVEDRIRFPLYIAFLGSHIRNIFCHLPISTIMIQSLIVLKTCYRTYKHIFEALQFY